MLIYLLINFLHKIVGAIILILYSLIIFTSLFKFKGDIFPIVAALLINIILFPLLWEEVFVAFEHLINQFLNV